MKLFSEKSRIIKTAAVLLLLCSTAVKAQVPGYQGKRFSVGYNTSSIVFFDYLSDFPEGARISYKSEISTHYTISRKASIGFSWYFAKQKFAFNDAYIESNTAYGYYSPKTEFVPCKLNMFEFNIQFFNRNFVAPAGIYHQFGFGIVKYRLGTADGNIEMQRSSNYYTSNPGASTYTFTGMTSAYTCAKLSYHIGKMNPVGHHLYINSAFGINLFQSGDMTTLNNTTSSNNYIIANLNKNIWRHNIFEIKLGLGWLAF